jgi:hypothetical protein
VQQTMMEMVVCLSNVQNKNHESKTTRQNVDKSMNNGWIGAIPTVARAVVRPNRSNEKKEPLKTSLKQ